MLHSERLPNHPRSAAAARRVVERLGEEVDPITLANLRLLVSELVTNAVEHARAPGDIGLEVGLRDGIVRVEVIDGGAGFTPELRREADPLSSGWGLRFVDRLSERWGTDAAGGGRVWFELPARVRAHRA